MSEIKNLRINGDLLRDIDIYNRGYHLSLNIKETAAVGLLIAPIFIIRNIVRHKTIADCVDNMLDIILAGMFLTVARDLYYNGIKKVSNSLHEVTEEDLNIALNNLNSYDTCVSFEDLLKAKCLNKRRKFEKKDHKIPKLVSEKYIEIPSEKGKQLFLQRHAIGSNNYFLDKVEPEESAKVKQKIKN